MEIKRRILGDDKLKEIRQYFVYFFDSKYLKDNDYNINMSFDEARDMQVLIQTFESQVIRSINDIRGNRVSEEEYFRLKDLKKRIMKTKNSRENYKELVKVQKKLDEAMFMPDYVIIEMKHNSHYDYLFANGLKLNGKLYKRFSCSASQARVSNVMFANTEIIDELNKRIDNGRNLNKELVSSKFNAYKGLSSSATRLVTEPRFCVVPDIEVEKDLECWYVTETPDDEDDILDKRTVQIMTNLFDGQGLITPEFAKVWAKDLEVEYIPAQFCIRQSYIKGMLCTFDILKFCEEKNDGKYIIKDIYGDEVDLRDIDVVLTESQFKLWDSYPNLKNYIDNCHKNKQYWGVSLFTPEKDKDILHMNYQFLQTLNLDDEDIEKLCSQFLDWAEGISVDNPEYALMYMLGKKVTKRVLTNFMDNGDDWLGKSFAVNREIINDKYFRERMYDSLKVQIQQACLGRIIVDGNFQVMVSDPYGLMEHICGLEVKGLLGKKEYYSAYWNNKGVKRVSASRSPLNYKSEHLVYDLVQNEEMNEWYKYCYTGIILNIHGTETVNHGGSDFDYDIIATSSNEVVIKGIDMTELPIYYEPPKSTKKVLTEEDLFLADKFGFGSIIGSITNKGSSSYALMANYDKDSSEYKELLNRVRMCTKLQSAQIDKAKIGREVKGIPNKWIRSLGYNSFERYDEEYVLNAERRNDLLVDRHPYFFIYLYEDTRRKYNQYKHKKELESRFYLGMELSEVLEIPNPNKEQKEFIDGFIREAPIIFSNSVMNKICRHIEKKTKNIKAKLRNSNPDIWKELYLNDDYEFDKNKWNRIKKQMESIRKQQDTHLKIIANYNRMKNATCPNELDDIANEINKINTSIIVEEKLRKEYILNTLLRAISNKRELANYMVKYYYEYKPSISKKDLWSMFGDCMFENVVKNTGNSVMCVYKEDKDGDFEYLGARYKREGVEVDFEI